MYVNMCIKSGYNNTKLPSLLHPDMFRTKLIMMNNITTAKETFKLLIIT